MQQYGCKMCAIVRFSPRNLHTRVIWEKTLERLVWAEGILLVVVLVLMPLYAVWVGRKQAGGLRPTLKGLALPEGSIRGMLALMSVGSFVILLVLGPGAPEMKEFFDKALAAFGTLTGAIIGFYFGNRGSTAAVAPQQPPATVPSLGPTQGNGDITPADAGVSPVSTDNPPNTTKTD